MYSNGQRTTHATWSVFITCVILVALFIGALLVSIPVSSSKKANASLTESSFLQRANSASKEKFVATYVVTGNEEIYLFVGTATVAQIPFSLSHKRHFSREGYAPPDRYLSYLLHERNGTVVQWIQSGSNVSWCLKLRGFDAFKLKCTGLSPFIPSNGYAEESVPYIPATALGLVENYVRGQPLRRPPVVYRSSATFGPLRCLLQTSGTPHLTTCINAKGIIVSSFSKNGSNWSRATLVSVDYDPQAKFFATLLKPSDRVALPPV